MNELQQLIEDAKARQAAKRGAAIEQALREEAEQEEAAAVAGVRAFARIAHEVPEPLHQYRLATTRGEGGSCSSHEKMMEHLATWKPEKFRFAAPGLGKIEVSVIRNVAGERIYKIAVADHRFISREFGLDWDAAIEYAAEVGDAPLNPEDIPF